MSNAIHEFVLKGGQSVTTAQMADLRSKIPFLRAKAETMQAIESPHLHDQALFLARYAEDVIDDIYPADDLSAVAEAVFALAYYFRDVDIIPDDVPGKGFTDDSAIIRTVLFGHEPEFRKFAAASSLDYDRLTLAP